MFDNYHYICESLARYLGAELTFSVYNIGCFILELHSTKLKDR